jgi:phage shock protein C
MGDEPKRLYRSKKERMLAGVCGGLGVYFNVDPVLLRIVFVALTFLSGVGIILYIILAIIIPNEPGGAEPVEVGEKVKEVADEIAKGAQSVADEVAKGAKSLVEGVKGDESWFSDTRNLIGLIIILIGFLALLDQLFPWFFSWGFFWALVIIAVGFYLILRG